MVPELRPFLSVFVFLTRNLDPKFDHAKTSLPSPKIASDGLPAGTILISQSRHDLPHTRSSRTISSSAPRQMHCMTMRSA